MKNSIWKRAAALLCGASTLLSFSAMGTTAFAEVNADGYEIADGSGITIYADQLEVTPDQAGKEIAVSLNISGNPGYTKLTANIHYDDRLVPVLPNPDNNPYSPKYDIGPASSGLLLSMAVNNNENAKRIGGSTMGSRNNNTDGALWTAYFTLPDDLTVGDEFPLQTIVVSDMESSNDHLAYEGYNTEDGWIRVVEPEGTTPDLPGDYEIVDGSAITISADHISVTPDQAGEEVAVSLNITTNPGYTNLTANIQYDERLVPVILDPEGSPNVPKYDVGPASAGLGFIMAVNNNEGVKRIGGASIGTLSNINDGALWTVYFTLPDDLTVGDMFPLQVNVFGDIINADIQLAYRDFSIVDGYIEVVESEGNTEPAPSFTIGEMDGKEGITINDAQLALEIANAKVLGVDITTTYPEEQLLAADVDGNGQIVTADAQYILTFANSITLGINPTWEDIIPKQASPQTVALSLNEIQPDRLLFRKQEKLG